ncbi:MAG: cyclase family protein [Candidatus Dormibacteraceae bacterium]
MRIHDVTLPLSSDIPTWPGDPTYHRELASSIAKGAPANVSRLDFGAHTGTHVDAPVHFVEGGGGVETMSLDALVGPCLVVEADPPGHDLRPQDLPRNAFEPGTRRILFKTRNSRHWANGDREFDTEFVAIGPDLARRLVEMGVLLVGVDYLSVESYHAAPEHPVHHALLEARTAIVEGLDLSRVEPGAYLLYCLPAKLKGSDGAPARVLLISE